MFKSARDSPKVPHEEEGRMDDRDRAWGWWRIVWEQSDIRSCCTISPAHSLSHHCSLSSAHTTCSPHCSTVLEYLATNQNSKYWYSLTNQWRVDNYLSSWCLSISWFPPCRGTTPTVPSLTTNQKSVLTNQKLVITWLSGQWWCNCLDQIWLLFLSYHLMLRQRCQSL